MFGCGGGRNARRVSHTEERPVIVLGVRPPREIRDAIEGIRDPIAEIEIKIDGSHRYREPRRPYSSLS